MLSIKAIKIKISNKIDKLPRTYSPLVPFGMVPCSSNSDFFFKGIHHIKEEDDPNDVEHLQDVD